MHSIHCVPLHRHATCKQKQGETKAEQTTATHIQSTRAPPPNHQQWRAWRLFGRCPTGGRVLEVLKKTSCTWRPTARQRTVPSLHPGPDRPLDDFHPNRVANVIRLIMHTGLNQPTVSSSTRARQFRSRTVLACTTCSSAEHAWPVLYTRGSIIMGTMGAMSAGPHVKLRWVAGNHAGRQHYYSFHFIIRLLYN